MTLSLYTYTWKLDTREDWLRKKLFTKLLLNNKNLITPKITFKKIGGTNLDLHYLTLNICCFVKKISS